MSTTWENDLKDDGERVLAVKANGGSVIVEKLADRATQTWVASDTFTADTVQRMKFGTGPTRVRVTGSAKFEVYG